MKNIGIVLDELGLGPGDVIKTTIFLVNMDDFAVVNEIYGSFFDAQSEGAQPGYPARSTVAVAALPKGALVEVECIAAR